ncbi:MAG: UTP--glucose-1-phosphate uridylyltransferase [Chitinispirillales bacterium]|nr:UTP--glucose-1-phosphate uridylyltransferase [Chitinispirillales bacterium]
MSNITNEITKILIDKMEREGQPKVAINTFLHYYDLLSHGSTGYISEDEIIPVTPEEIDDFSVTETLRSAGADALSKTVIIKLNGGLGTTMGLSAAKSLIPVKDGLSFLDITALQIKKLNEKFGISIPLILMNSFNTERDSLTALEKYQEIKTEMPFSFIQHKFPKILASNLKPVSNPKNAQLEWNPPGHGDLYAAIYSSKILDSLLNRGYRYAFISNIDNLGATLDSGILGYFAEKPLSFLMEVTDRTFMDRKGGHLARFKNGKLVLREIAQCPPEAAASFSDIKRHRYFNTNNLWIRLEALSDIWKKGLFNLPMIRNIKKLDVRDSQSPDVIQLESAMGSAISVFEKTGALRVPRTRFAPVKNCEELLLLWSDYYELCANYHITINPRRKAPQVNISLDQRFYGNLDQLKERFPWGAPGLAECESLKITGDVRFGKDISITGQTVINNTKDTAAFIPDGSRLTGSINI